MKLISKDISLTFEQDADCRGSTDGDDHNYLDVESTNGSTKSSDAFVVISTERWAVDSGQELRDLGDEVDKLLKEVRKPKI